MPIGVVDHLVHDAADGGHVGIDEQAEAGQRNAGEQSRAERLGGLCLHNQRNDKNNYGNRYRSSKCIKYIGQSF